MRGLTENQKKTLELIVANPTITYRELRDKLGVKNISQVACHTAALAKKLFIEKGKRTYSRWIIKDKWPHEIQ